jgi:hypothetical protein
MFPMVEKNILGQAQKLANWQGTGEKSPVLS